MWEEVTYLKYAATGASHQKFPEVFRQAASWGRQSLSFVSALMVMCSLRVCACWREKREAKVEKDRKCHGSLCCICCRPCEGVAKEIRCCQGLNTATCSSPCWIIPWCLQAVLNTTLSALSYLSQRTETWGSTALRARKKNLGQSSFWHGKVWASRWAALMKATQ